MVNYKEKYSVHFMQLSSGTLPGTGGARRLCQGWKKKSIVERGLIGKAFVISNLLLLFVKKPKNKKNNKQTEN